MNQETILKLIDKISIHGMEFVENGFEKKQVQVFNEFITSDNKGVFLKVEDEEICIFYSSCLHENGIEDYLLNLKNITQEYILNLQMKKEVCFNVYGYNLKTIKIVRELGFKIDSEGFHMKYNGQVPIKKKSELEERGFHDSMIDEFEEVFNDAYYQLDIDNNREPNYFTRYKTQFHDNLKVLNTKNQVKSFWLNNDLVGVYIYYNNYITDLVIKPKYQNQGYGSYLLKHCIINMKHNSIENIRLRVAKTNIAAKRFYERNNFIEVSSYSEHTLI